MLLKASTIYLTVGDKTRSTRPGFYLSLESYPPCPFQRIKSADDKDTGIVALIAPFYNLAGKH